MLIPPAFAQPDIPANVEPPSMGEAFLYNAAFIFLVVAVFYLVFIRPQQKRMSAQMEMLKNLKKGDKVITAGGLVGTIHKLKDDKEVELDLGNGQIVTILRSYLELASQTEQVPLKNNKPEKEEKTGKKLTEDKKE